MSNHSFKHNPGRSTWMRRVLIAILLIFLLSSLSACSAGAGQATQEAAQLSLSELEAQYGLRVNLVAVTAAGGLVDVRFKFIDGEKVKGLLQEPGNFPTLQVAGSPGALSVPEEGRPVEIRFEDDANLFLMYPNAGDIVKPGTPVTIVFGELQVEPIPAK